MAIAANLGYPRIGRRRELKRALEAYWSERADARALRATARALRATARAVRREGWLAQRAAGIDRIPVNDFSLYDHVLDAAVAVGAVPERYRSQDVLAAYFAMARGDRGRNLSALEMTKWFDTNYHYIVPEIDGALDVRTDAAKLLTEIDEARDLGLTPYPVLVGPITLALLSKRDSKSDGGTIFTALAAAYARILRELVSRGVNRVQLDEPCLVLNLDRETLATYERVYALLARNVPEIRITLATYFGALPANQLSTVLALPVDTLHLDLTRGDQPLEEILSRLPAGMMLSAGIVDGRNVWRTDLAAALKKLRRIAERLGEERLVVAPSCSLSHVPHDLEGEDELDAEVRSWLAFGQEKLREVRLLTDGVNQGESAIAEALEENERIVRSRRSSPRIHDYNVARRVREAGASALSRTSVFSVRQERQRAFLRLPILPTTTIGSLPQVGEVRSARADFRAGNMDREAYDAFLRAEIERGVRRQEEIGLDVLVHGEFERNDMVEYFGESLEGFAVTEYGWVQSYGSRCVKPPIIFGDVSRARPMTVAWARFAQSLTSKPMKGMLTGPVTILQWSFVRDDQPRSATAAQIALAIRDEVADLENAGIRIVQIDEPALREGLPLLESERAGYLRWATDAFRLASSGAKDETQIHTHMCYGDFNDILKAIADLDADVISIEASRSGFTLLDALVEQGYPNHIGLGVYDIHSPRVPKKGEIVEAIVRILEHLPIERVWVNPDCGLKTRGWPETDAALRAMVSAARQMRMQLVS